MEVTFERSKEQKLCNSHSKLMGQYGARMTALIEERLTGLAAAANLEELRFAPGRCHELKGDLSGYFAVDLVHPMRLIFQPTQKPPPLNAGGGIDWSQIKAIEIHRIMDYHG